MRIQRVDILLALACISAFACVALVAKHTRAQEQPHHHLHDFYKEWKQPGTMNSCCNARWQDGKEVGDCEETELFELRRDQDGMTRWYAYVPMIQRVIEVPDAKIVREKNPDQTGTRGHVCYSRSNGLLCAVPPAGVM